MLFFASITIIFSGLLAGVNNAGNELRGSDETDENSSEFPEDIKKEIASESDAEMKVFDEVPRRKRPNAGKRKLSRNSSFVRNNNEKKRAGNGKEDSNGTSENFSESKNDIKKELVSESYAEIKALDGVPRRERTTTKKKKISPNSPFVNYSEGEKAVTTVEEKESGSGYYCEKCGIHFRYNSLLEQHFREKHPETAPSSCQYCKKPQWFQKNYKRHVRRIHPEKFHSIASPKIPEMKCELCDTMHKGAHALELHALNDHKGAKIFKCAECDVKFFYSNHLNFHVQSKHREHDEDDPFRCNICSKVFNRSDVLKSHKAICKERQKMKKHKGTTQQFTCKFCGGVFVGKCSYEAHVMKSHPDQKAFECTCCGAGFKRKWNLTLHFKNVHGKEILPCSYCTKCYGSEMVLKRHERYCGKKFSQEAFFCDICLMWRNGSSERHKFQHEKYDYCEFCDQRFHRENNPQGLSRHLEKRHRNRVSDNANHFLIAAHMTNSRDIKIKQENNVNF